MSGRINRSTSLHGSTTYRLNNSYMTTTILLLQKSSKSSISDVTTTILPTIMSTLPLNNSTVNTSYSNTTTSASTEPTPTDMFSGTYTTIEIVLTTLFLLIFCLGTFGNGLIYYYFGMKKRVRRSIPELLFCYLSVVDFVSSVCNPLLYVYWTLGKYKWHLGPWACKIILPLGTIATTISGGIFIIIAFDRQRSIVYPFLSHYSKRTIQTCVFGAFLYALLLNIHYAANISLDDYTKQCLIDDVSALEYSIPTVLCFVVQDITLIAVFAFTNFRIFAHLRSKDTALMLGALWEKRKKDSTRIIRLLVVLATVYFMLTLPKHIIQFVQIMSWFDGHGIDATPVMLHLNSVFKVLHTANSCVNVFIYYYMHKGFRRHAYKLCFLCPKYYAKRELSVFHNVTNITDANSTPRLLRALGQRSQSIPAANDPVVDKRLIDEVNVGRKRTYTETEERRRAPSDASERLLQVRMNDFRDSSEKKIYS